MTFGEKVLNKRLSLNLSQNELAEQIGVSSRSIHSYEQEGVLPRTAILKKLAAALNVSIAYMMDEEESAVDEAFIEQVRNEFGYKSAREAEAFMTRASAIFAGGELDDESKELFIQSLKEVYLESKAEAREKFSGKKRVPYKKRNE